VLTPSELIQKFTALPLSKCLSSCPCFRHSLVMCHIVKLPRPPCSPVLLLPGIPKLCQHSNWITPSGAEIRLRWVRVSIWPIVDYISQTVHVCITRIGKRMRSIDFLWPWMTPNSYFKGMPYIRRWNLAELSTRPLHDSWPSCFFEDDWQA